MRHSNNANRMLFAIAASIFFSATNATPAFPLGPMKLIVPFAAGASTDTVARVIGQAVAEDLKQSVVVENRTGAGGTIASDFVARQKPDGYTWMLSTDGVLSVNPSIYKALNYDSLKDFSSLSMAVAVPLVLAVRTDSPFKSLDDVIKHAKAHPNKLSYGSAGVGSGQHMAGELMKDMADVNITHVPYRGGAPAMADLLGGHTDMMFVQTSSSKDHVEQGKLRLLGIGSLQRSPMWPDIPTFDELGLKGYDADTWYGFSMPANADPSIVRTLNQSILKALGSTRNTLEQQGYTIVGSTPEEMQRRIEKNILKWRDQAKKAGIYQMQ